MITFAIAHDKVIFIVLAPVLPCIAIVVVYILITTITTTNIIILTINMSVCARVLV